MVKIDLSDFNRLAGEYRQRADRMRDDPFGRYRQDIGDAMRGALLTALTTGENKPQHLLNSAYQGNRGQGHYGSSAKGDQSRVNPQELLDPSGVAAVKAKYKMPGPHKAFYGSSAMRFTAGPNGPIFDLTTQATMTPYPYDPRYDPTLPKEQRHGPIQQLLPTKPIMAYLREGWVDPRQPNHRMNKRDIGKHVIEAFKPYLARIARWLLLSAGFRERT